MFGREINFISRVTLIYAPRSLDTDDLHISNDDCTDENGRRTSNMRRCVSQANYTSFSIDRLAEYCYRTRKLVFSVNSMVNELYFVGGEMRRE